AARQPRLSGPHVGAVRAVDVDARVRDREPRARRRRPRPRRDRPADVRGDRPRGGDRLPARRPPRGPDRARAGGGHRGGRLRRLLPAVGARLRRRAVAARRAAARWGMAVIADSAQFSTGLSELVDARYVGTALTAQTALGYGLTVVSIQLVPILVDAGGW